MIEWKEDRERVRRCIEGDEAAWRELSAVLAPVVSKAVRWAFRRRGMSFASGEWEEDILSAVLTHLLEEKCRRLREFRWECSLSTFLFITASRITIDRLRSERQERKKQAGWGSLQIHREASKAPLPELARKELIDGLQKGVERLSDAEQTLLAELYVHGRSYEELSALQSAPVSTLASRVAAARKKLFSFLKEMGLLSLL